MKPPSTQWQVVIVLIIVALIGAVVVVGGLGIGTQSRPVPPGPKGEVGCTLEARICPDGTAVGRSGPNCEFAPCP